MNNLASPLKFRASVREEGGSLPGPERGGQVREAAGRLGQSIALKDM